MGTYFIDKIRTIHAKLDKWTSAHAGKKVLKIGHKMCPKFVENMRGMLQISLKL